MPLTKKGRKIKRAMVRHYGAKVGTRVFHASRNKGTIKGVDRPSTPRNDGQVRPVGQT